MRRQVMAILVIAALVVVVSCSGSSDDASSTTTSTGADGCSSQPVDGVEYRTIDGVDPNLLSLDIDPVPGDCAAPVAIWVHGGGWQIGDKSNLADQRAGYFTSRGWMLVSVNYRLTTSDADPPVIYPDHNEDVAAALAWVHDHIESSGGDPDRVLFVGHSAGAGIAAAVSADPDYLGAHDLDPSWIDCLVLLDTAGYDVTNEANRGGDDGVYEAAFGDDPAVWVDASPTTHVGEGPLPARALVVTRGRAPRVQAATAFTDQLNAAGVDAELFEATGLTHAQVNRRIGRDDVMTPMVDAVLERCA